MRSILFTLAAVVMAVFIGVGSSFAGVDGMQGNKSISIDASLSNKSIEPEGGGDMDIKTTLIGLKSGYWFTDNIEALASLRMIKMDQDDYTVTSNFFGALMNYNFITSSDSVVPYVGIQLGMNTTELEGAGADTDSTDFSYGAQAGMKFFLSENLSFNTELDYIIYQLDSDDDDMEIDVKDTMLLLGLSYYFLVASFNLFVIKKGVWF